MIISLKSSFDTMSLFFMSAETRFVSKVLITPWLIAYQGLFLSMFQNMFFEVLLQRKLLHAERTGVPDHQMLSLVMPMQT